MKRLLPLLALLCLPMVMQAQLLEKITVKEILPVVTGKAHSDFATDAVLTNTMFFGFSYQGVALEMDLADAKATGWLYRYYSPNLDSSMFFIGVKIPIVGVQALKLPLDTITQYFPVTIGTTQLIEPWVDSDAALQGSRNGGAETFLQSNPDATVSLAFTINNPIANRYLPQGQYWFFRYIAAADTLTCLVHANTGLPFRCFSGNAPTILSLPPTSARVGALYTYSVTAFGDPSPTYALDTAPAGMTIDAVSGRIEWTPAAGQDGKQQVTVVARNASGTDTQSFEITVQVAGNAPKILSTPVTEAIAGKPYTYQLASSGTPQPVYTLDQNPAGMLLDGGRGSVFWTPTRLQAGTHPVSIKATNSAGTDVQNFSVEVATSPVIAAIANQRIAPEREFTIAVSVDAHPAPSFSLNAGPAGLAIDPLTGLITWTPTALQVGSHTVLFEASNRAGKNQRSFEIEVDATVHAGTPAAPAAFRIVSQYPHPAAQTLHVTLTAQRAGTVELRVHDALGRRVLSRSVPVDANGLSYIALPVSSLENGLYTLQLIDGTDSLQRHFVVAR